MRTISSLLAGLTLLAAFVHTVHAQPGATPEVDPVDQLPWIDGPATGEIGERATIEIPEGYAFLGPKGAAALNELMENPPSGVDEYVVAPRDLSWTAYFSFNDIGYVQDDESLEPDAILSSVREGTEAGNAVRRERGWDTMKIVGWSFKPQYDEQLNALEWAILAELEQSGHQVVNYNTRFLGRHGVMEVIVAADPEGLAASITDFKQLMPGYAFAAGEKYAEFREGDRVAEFGLAALITGGAAAVAAKKGWIAAIGAFLLKGWKLLLVGAVGLGAFARRIFRGRRADDSQS
jgi:uncharacterized membrane-anchored protein